MDSLFPVALQFLLLQRYLMLDEYNGNKQLAETIKNNNHNYFDYEVWQTDHPFTNKRISLINKVIEFLDR